MSVKEAYLYAVLGAALWGIIGLFVQPLYSYGFTAWEIVAIRAIFSALLLVGYLIITNRKMLRIHIRDLPLFIGTGIISIVFFNWCFFTVIDQSNLSLAVVLLYTGPFFVTVFSRIFFKEWLTSNKVTALVLTIIGCAFVVGLLPSFNTVITPYILLVGIGSGFFYALYSIFAKVSSKRYSSMTITTYSFICAAIFMIPTSGLWNKAHLFAQIDVVGYGLGLAFFPTVLAYLLYTRGLAEIESSRASILSTIEPVVAIGIGFLIFKDQLSLIQWFGVALVLFSIFLVSKPDKARSIKKQTPKHAV
ncbi:EamA family transporter [Alkalihalophilus pseudofirmus]|uniref:EamA family transporter n=1 Tax=Alkalihalophilus pseudofirmus TaxID=79885 RepID=A0AAJ2KZY4_ALKPS|nr:EamA family transporter [Alkalihalophilus pseudofirmus]MDV2885073.1 EamA family transporter [Alkalihalophilus pseudofirmus]